MTELHFLIAQIIAATAQGKKVSVRRRRNKVYLAQSPTINKKRILTPAQEEHKNRFSAAASYAIAAMANPELENLYRTKSTAERSKYNYALRDYMKAPEVKKIEVAGCSGNVGSTIRIEAKDDFIVREVNVSIYNKAGDLIEEGKALIHPIHKFQWFYTTTRKIAKLKYCKIRAVAEDLPGNKAELMITL